VSEILKDNLTSIVAYHLCNFLLYEKREVLNYVIIPEKSDLITQKIVWRYL